MPFFEQKKILNDPVYGFIPIPGGLFDKIIHHPWFQRLRRIRQLGMTYLVYPGATHSRFLHTMGCFYLTNNVLTILKEKNIPVSSEEGKGVLLAILLHDIGHGPFSHALEGSIVPNISHEKISLAYMKHFNNQFGELDMAIKIFKNNYEHRFLHAIISSQLDTDRLDYLKRDSFFTGVSEGVISTDRIIKMINVVNDELVIEEKGLYSVEKFIIARRLMYWQVYLHKTVVSSEMLLRNIIRRARELSIKGQDIWGTKSLQFFLCNTQFELDHTMLTNFANLDDDDIVTSLKVWQNYNDPVLSRLCKQYLHRDLFKIELQKTPFSENEISEKRLQIAQKYNILEHEAAYFVISDVLSNNAYKPGSHKISILSKNGIVTDISKASVMFNHEKLSQVEKKYFLCYPRVLC